MSATSCRADGRTTCCAVRMGSARGVVEVSFGWDAGRQYLPLWMHLTGYQARVVRACAARRRCLRETVHCRDPCEHCTLSSSSCAGAGRRYLVDTTTAFRAVTPCGSSCECIQVLYLEAGGSIQRAYLHASREAAAGWRHENAGAL